MLEPYEGKLSRTVLRGGRSGNAPLPLGAVSLGEKGRIEKSGDSRKTPDNPAPA